MKVKFLLIVAVILLISLFAGCTVVNSAESSYQTSNNSYNSSYSEEQSVTESSSADTEDISEVAVMYITINSNKLKVDLAQNTSVDALVELLKQGDITYTADDYGNFEKVGSIGHSLPRNDEDITTEPGDVILYQGSSICLYYGVNTWSFTRIGKINGYTTAELKSLLCAGSGSIEVTLSLN